MLRQVAHHTTWLSLQNNISISDLGIACIHPETGPVMTPHDKNNRHLKLLKAYEFLGFSHLRGRSSREVVGTTSIRQRDPVPGSWERINPSFA